MLLLLRDKGIIINRYLQKFNASWATQKKILIKNSDLSDFIIQRIIKITESTDKWKTQAKQIGLTYWCRLTNKNNLNRISEKVYK